MSSDTRSSTSTTSRDSTPRYFYAGGGRNPLTSSYSNNFPFFAQPADQKRLAHLATPTIFTQSRLQRAKEKSEAAKISAQESHSGAKRDVLKCLNCGLKGHSILKCDKISRFCELNCHDPASDSEDILYRRSRSIQYAHNRGDKSRKQILTMGLQCDISPDINNIRLPRCRMCGLNGHLTMHCDREAHSPLKSNDELGLGENTIPRRKRTSRTPSPSVARRQLELLNLSSDIDGLIGKTIPIFEEVNSSNDLNISKAMQLTKNPNYDQKSSNSLPSRLKSTNLKRVRIDMTPTTPPPVNASTNRRELVTSAGENDNDSGLGCCGSSDVEVSPCDASSEVTDLSKGGYESEPSVRSSANNKVVLENGDEIANSVDSSGQMVRSESMKCNKIDEKKLYKLRLKVIKSWFKKSVEK